MNISSVDFADFFHAIHGYEPFPWQQALVDHLANTDEWPDVLDLPTGSGKTAALDIALFHLALRQDAPQKAALRIVLVVDRRLVVDNAFDHAKRIVDTLNDSEHKTVKEIASRLKKLSGDDAKPLIAKRLRGGMPLEHDWARTPTQPTILCSTVDQVGSRLLFRGYGVTDRMKPIHAGLLGTDSLIFLDEAHLSIPFKQTLAAVQDEDIGKAGIKTVLLSATPDGAEKLKKIFGLKSADYEHPVLKNRLKSPKPSALKIVKVAEAPKRFAESARKMAEQLLETGIRAPAVGVIVNRVKLARDIFKELNSNKEIGDVTFDIHLMTGRSRSIDRDEISKKLEPFLTEASEQERSEATPLFVVATQCLEVGVDLDLDGLITQAAPLDALRQRFGRLNRAGRELTGKWFPAKGIILALTNDIKKTSNDFVYGDCIYKTWEKLEEIAEISGNGEVDFGIGALNSCLQEAGITSASLSSPRAEAPVVMPAYLDLWSRTSPKPAADPEVGLFLHGAERASPEVSIVWRSDISGLIESGRKGNLSELMKLVPPRAAEAISVPLWAVRDWLRNKVNTPQHNDIADVPAREPESSFESDGSEPLRAFRWAGPDDPHTKIVRPSELRPGDVLVVSTEYGGYDKSVWAPASKVAVKDVADEAAEPFQARRYAVRVTPDVSHWSLLSKVLLDESVRNDELVDELIDVLPPEPNVESDDERSSGQPFRSVRKPLERLKRAKGGKIIRYFPYTGKPDGGVVLLATNGLEGEDENEEDIAAPSTEDDTLSETSREPVLLNNHGKHVEDFVKYFTQTLMPKTDIADDLCLAAFLHDAGKADQRFQIMLSGGDLWNYSGEQALAKSGQNSYKGKDVVSRAGLPKGWRHEALSVRMAQAHPRFKKAHDPALVLWLIGTHHGQGRPFFNFTDPDENTTKQKLLPCLDVPEWQLELEKPGPQSPTFEFDGADWPSLFERLKQKYGIWKLAYLETIIRLADHRASEKERKL